MRIMASSENVRAITRNGHLVIEQNYGYALPPSRTQWRAILTIPLAKLNEACEEYQDSISEDKEE